jgi:Flp pilus assembly protein TadG
MQQKNQNRKRKRERGQALVEGALIIIVFLASLIGAMDFGQLLFTHNLMVERVRAGVRWGVANSWDGTGDRIANVVRYNNSTVGDGATPFLGLTRDNVSVVRTLGTTANPNDQIITVSIVGYDYKLFSPWIAHTYTGNYVAVESGVLQP